MSYASPTGTSEDGTVFYREMDIAKVSNLGKANEKVSTSLKLMPPGNVCLHVQPEGQYYGDDTPIMRKPNNTDGLVVFQCKHITQKADATSGKVEKICNKIFQGDLSKINLGTFRSHSKAKHWRDKGPIHPTIPGQGKLSFTAAPKKKKQKTSNSTVSSVVSLSTQPTIRIMPIYT